MPIVRKRYLENEFHVTYSVEDDCDGMRLDQYLQRYLTSLSREQIKRKIERGEISIKGRSGVNRPGTKVRANDLIDLLQKDSGQESEVWGGEELTLVKQPETIFEDECLIVISKPPFMVTHPTGRHIFNCATVYFETKYGKTIHSIHRLDRETSGLLMLGKDPTIAAELTALFEQGKVSKSYFFIAHKTKDVPNSFSATERLLSEDFGLRKVVVEPFPANSNEGKHALTNFEIIWQNDKYVMGLAFPKTGRQHQIRVHAMVHGLPLVGDKIYHGGYELFQRFKDIVASKEDHDLMEISRHALHAVALKLTYKGEEKIFRSKLPDDFVDYINLKQFVKINKLEVMISKTLDRVFL